MEFYGDVKICKACGNRAQTYSTCVYPATHFTCDDPFESIYKGYGSFDPDAIIHCTCKRCGYTWSERPLYQKKDTDNG